MLPEKFLERMEKMLGEEYPQFLSSYEKEEYHSLRVNPLKGEKEAFLQQAGFALSSVVWNENGYYYDPAERPGRHPYHDAGVYYIQEASAMAPAGYLKAQPGERVLDLCAAPGGKSTQIGASMGQQGILVCNEIHPARAKILSENVERMGIQNAIVTSETPQRLLAAFPEYFDRILVDAPCSGEGMFRKNEDACGEWSPENVQFCADRQDEILDCAADMLIPGGRMVYSTCTFAPAENEGSVGRFLLRHREFCLEPVEKFPGMESGVADWAWGCPEDGRAEASAENSMGLEHTIRLWPHRLLGEGHYVAVLKKEGEKPEGNRIPQEKGIQEKECKEYLTFLKDTVGEDTAVYLRKGTLLRFGDQLYLAPPGTPCLDKLRVLRPGLHLGTMKKNRFEPSHALALTLKPAQVQRTWNLSADSPEMTSYLKGQTLTAEGEKGWYLIAVDGYSIGWGKLSGSTMKNHYPKGLRRM